jgi:hypothetical protein
VDTGCTVLNRRNIKFFFDMIKRAREKISSHGRPMRETAWLMIALSLVASCRSKDRVVPPAPSGALLVQPGSGVQVSLTWSAPVDLDLYVTDPSLETVYFANPVAQTGGRLEQDVTCRTLLGSAVQLERARWDHPPAGHYRVGVDFIDACRSKIEEAEFRVVIAVDGRLREKTARLAKERFQPAVVEFDVP